MQIQNISSVFFPFSFTIRFTRWCDCLKLKNLRSIWRKHNIAAYLRFMVCLITISYRLNADQRSSILLLNTSNFSRRYLANVQQLSLKMRKMRGKKLCILTAIDFSNMRIVIFLVCFPSLLHTSSLPVKNFIWQNYKYNYECWTLQF